MLVYLALVPKEDVVDGFMQMTKDVNFLDVRNHVTDYFKDIYIGRLQRNRRRIS